MSKKKRKGQYRVLAVAWTVAATSMALGVIRQLPDTNPMSCAILVLSAACAAIWWSAYLKASKNNDSK